MTVKRLIIIVVNMIVVIGNEKLTVEMQKLFSEQAYPSHRVTVLKIPRSPGVADLDPAYKERIQGYQLRNYFYGAPLQLPEELSGQSTGNLKLGGEASMDLTLSPHSTVLSFDDIHIYRIGQGV
jgi:polyribonucleotide 5'-hydroxyl-kinase